MERKTDKKSQSQAVKKQSKADRIADEPKLIWFGWLVLIIPMSIVIFLSFFEGLPWVAERSAQGSLAEATDANTRGLKVMKTGHHREAHGYFNKALKIDPDNAEAYMNLGILFNLREDYDQAIRYFQQALQHEEKHKELIYNNLGMVYAKKGDHREALQMFEQALTAGVRSISIYRNIGALCMRTGDYNRAVEAYRDAIDHHPTLERLYLDMLTETLNKYDPDEAERDNVYAEAFESIREQLNYGIEEIDMMEYDTVITNEYLRNDPKLVEDYRNLATVYNKIGIMHGRDNNYEQALAAFLEAVRINPDYEEALDNLRHCRRMVDEADN